MPLMTHERDEREEMNVRAEEFPLEKSQRRGIIVRYLRYQSRDPARCQCWGGKVRPQGGMFCRSQTCEDFYISSVAHTNCKQEEGWTQRDHVEYV